MAERHLEQFKKLLAELFMFDQADLDFGIYRIMNAKREEITRFLERDLLPQVRDALGVLGQASRAAVEAELTKAIEQAKGLGAEAESLPKVKALRQQLSEKADIGALEDEVFSDLYSFFHRYYNEGDFLSLRRYKEGVYAIPYEGEEVKLHWANADQYYIKTAEYFRDYAFNLSDGRRVHFKLADANTKQNNNKAMNGQERRFVLREADPIGEEKGDLVIRFEYMPDPENRKQADLNAQMAQRILQAEGARNWIAGLATKVATEKNPIRTLLDKRLSDYTARNTFDYFIHKDLGGFLRRELDFYIKNEVMHLDDIESESTTRVEQRSLARIKTIRRIAHKIIDFLAHIENFQKRLWLKKKFVVETNYCITLDRIPDELYSAIAANESQREEWVRLFGIDEIKADLTRPGYSVPLTENFLKANKHLVLDTKHMDEGFKARMLRGISGFEEQLDGVLIHSENFQALNLVNRNYSDRVKCVYIDPPFNSPSTEIPYKNDYKHSSWLSLMNDRIALTQRVLNDGVFVVAIDENEQERLGLLLDENWLRTFEKVCVSIRHNPRGIQGKNFSHCHEYAYFMYPSDARKYIGDRKLEEPDVRNLRDSGLESDRTDARNCFYPFVVRDESIVGIGEVPEDGFHPRTVNEARPDGSLSIWPLDTSGAEKKWRYARQSVEEILPKLQVRQTRGKYEIYFAKETGTVRTLWTGAQFDASEYGTKLLQDMFGTKDLDFAYPKSLFTLTETLGITTKGAREDYVLDFFAGSGTTGHAIIHLNREDGGNRRYVLVEMGDYFNTVLLPRIKKAVYSKDWKNGKPVSREGVSQMLKYIRLESYEDSLNNLELRRTREQGGLLDHSATMREDYVLRYMLDVESKHSASLLDLERFEDPFNYKLNVGAGTAGETRPANVDLVETFNWLLGLRVKHIDTIRGFRVVQGSNPAGEKALVIWRNTREKSNADLDDFFLKQGYNTRDMEFDLIYVNGDNNLENLKRPDETWKVRLIEEEFKALMFDVEDA
ncbi:MAG TPA: DNA methyltransferase [Terriglobales bacterium]|nr:DNA methyltransferase [Terriglobales bacterium]